jgi:hypothetical protein
MRTGFLYVSLVNLGTISASYVIFFNTKVKQPPTADLNWYGD